MKDFLKKQSRTVWWVGFAVAFVLFIASTFLIHNATALAFSYVICIMLILFSIPHLKKKKKPKQKRASNDHDPYRLMPQDKGKIIEFPHKKG